MTLSRRLPNPVTNRSPDTGSSQILSHVPQAGRLVPRAAEQGQEPSGTAATRGPCTLAAELGRAVRSAGALRSHLIWRYGLFHPNFQKFSSSPQKASFHARRQLSLLTACCWCLLPAGQGTPARCQQGCVLTHPITLWRQLTTVNRRAEACQQQPGCPSRAQHVFL